MTTALEKPTTPPRRRSRRGARTSRRAACTVELKPATLDLSVVIVNWNTRTELDACVRSVKEGRGGLDLEIIVIDNASADGSADMVEREHPDVTLIRNDVNRGFGAANNQGMRIARGRYVLLLNPDTVVLEDALPRAVALADREPDVGIVGCQVMESYAQVQRTCFRFPSPWNTLLWVTGLAGLAPCHRLFGRAAYGPWSRTERRTVDVVSGMFMLARREAIADVGLMDEDYFVYAEEADWCWRFRNAGWPCVFDPVGRVLHVDGGNKSTDQDRLRMFVEKQKNVLLFQRKNLGKRAAFISRCLFALGMGARTAIWSVRSIVQPGDEHRARLAESWWAFRFHLLGHRPPPPSPRT